MKTKFALLLGLALLCGGAYADEQKSNTKKSEKAKAKAAKKSSQNKSSQNMGQKAESSVGKALHDSKIWTRSENRSR